MQILKTISLFSTQHRLKISFIIKFVATICKMYKIVFATIDVWPGMSSKASSFKSVLEE